MPHKCEGCGGDFDSPRKAKYCSDTCRQRGHRRGKEPESTGGRVEAACFSALVAADEVGTPLGASVLALAAQIDSGRDTGSSMAAAVRELRTVLAELRVKQTVDPVDELQRRRELRRAGSA